MEYNIDGKQILFLPFSPLTTNNVQLYLKKLTSVLVETVDFATRSAKAPVNFIVTLKTNTGFVFKVTIKFTGEDSNAHDPPCIFATRSVVSSYLYLVVRPSPRPVHAYTCVAYFGSSIRSWLYALIVTTYRPNTSSEGHWIGNTGGNPACTKVERIVPNLSRGIAPQWTVPGIVIPRGTWPSQAEVKAVVTFAVTAEPRVTITSAP